MLAVTAVPGIVSSARGIRTGGGDLETLLSRVALTGGALLAAQDTEGHPGIGYRVQESSRRAKQKTVKQGKRAARRAHRQVETASTKARGALAR